MSEKTRIIVILVVGIFGLIAFTSTPRRKPAPKESVEARRERWLNTADPRGNAQFRIAQQEAIRRWPEFVDAFNKREAKASYSVRARFADGDNTEWMWVQVDALDGDSIRGTLNNEPIDVKNVKNGQRVTVKREDVDDWMVERDGRRLHGGFTENALKQAQAERRVGR